MANVLIVRADWSDSAAISSSTSGTDTLPVANLKKKQPGDIWETSVNTSIITLDRYVTSKPFNFVGLLYTNMTTVSTWQVEASNAPTFPGNAGDYDSGVVTFVGSPTLITPERRHGFVLPSSANMNFGEEGYILGGSGGLARRYVRISLTNSGASTIQAGRLIVGQAYQPTKNYSEGANPFGLIDPTVVTETVGGQRIPREGAELRHTCRFALALLDKSETYMNVPAIMEACGAKEDVLVILDPAESTYVERMMFYGTLAARQSISNTAYDLFEQTFEVEELP